MLTRLELKNFKCFEDFTLPLAPLTLLTGLNNSGKSTILQSLRMLQFFKKSHTPNLPGHGTLNELRNRNLDLSVGIEIKVSDKSKQTHYHMAIDGEMAGKYKDSNLSLPVIGYLSADRLGPRVHLPLFVLNDDLVDVGPHGEYFVDFLAHFEQIKLPDSLRHPASEGNTLDFNVNGWLQEIAPGVKFSKEVYDKIDVSQATFNGFRPLNVGFGLSYTIPVLVLLLGMSADWTSSWPIIRRTEIYVDSTIYMRKEKHGSLVLIENPEAHLHPKGQSAMGRLIALVAATGVQIIVETHSDHLMDGIRIAVKEGLLEAKNVAFHYFAQQEEGQPKLKSPKLHPNGKLDHWPDGFFDQSIKNMAKLAQKD